MRFVLLVLLASSGLAFAAGATSDDRPTGARGPVAASRFDAGMKLVQEGKWRAAEAAFRDAVRARPDHAPSWSELGHTLKMQQRYDDAVRAYQKALALESDLVQAIEYLGEAYVAMGKKADAEQQLARLEKLDDIQAARLREVIKTGKISTW